jgi:hypothetical protein
MRFYNRQARHYCGNDLRVKTMYVCILYATGQICSAGMAEILQRPLYKMGSLNLGVVCLDIMAVSGSQRRSCDGRLRGPRNWWGACSAAVMRSTAPRPPWQPGLTYPS